MPQVLLFHSALGIRAGITSLADALRAAGHDVTVIDQYDGRVFDTYPEAMAHVEALGMPTLMASALDAAREVDGDLVTIGWSNGAGMAQWVAANLPERTRGVVMGGGGLDMKWLERDWPPSVQGQIHHTEGDPYVDEGSDEAVAHQAEAAGGRVEVFVYPGDGHLFTDPSLPQEYDEASARLCTERIVAFVDSVS